LATGLPDRQT